MLHFFLVVFIFALAACQTAALLIPRIFILLGDKENYNGAAGFFKGLVEEVADSDSKLVVASLVALIIGVVGALFLLATAPFTLVTAASYALYTGLGSKIFALIVFSIAIYRLCQSVPNVVSGIKDDLNPHATDCLCEKCVKTREIKAQAEEEGFGTMLSKLQGGIRKTESKMLLMNLPEVVYTWYFLYLIW